MKNLGTVVSFDATSEKGILELDNGNSLNFNQEDIGLNIKGSLIVSKDVIVYHEKSKIMNIIPKNHMQYKDSDDFVERKYIAPTKTVSSFSGSIDEREGFFTKDEKSNIFGVFGELKTGIIIYPALLVLLFGSFWFSSTKQGERIFEPIFGEEFVKTWQDNYYGILGLWRSYGTEFDITKYECSDVAEMIRGMDQKDEYGEDLKVLSIENLEIVSKNTEKVICSGTIHIQGQKKYPIHMFIEDQSDSSLSYGYESTPPEHLECSQVADLVKDLKPQNNYGATFNILSIKNTRLVSKDPKKIICIGTIHLSDNTKTQYNMIVEQSDEGQLYSIEEP